MRKLLISFISVLALTLVGAASRPASAAPEVVGDAYYVWDMTVGPDGALWFAGLGGGNIGRVDPVTHDNAYFPVAANTYPFGITAAADGNLYVTAGDALGRFNPTSHVYTPYTDAQGEVDDALGIAVGPDGGLWFASSGNDRIGRLDPFTGDIKTWTTAGLDRPKHIVAGPDGGLWFTASDSDDIGRIDPVSHAIQLYSSPGVDAPEDLVVGPDGDLWFTAQESNNVSHLDPTTKVFTVGTSGAGGISGPISIEVGADDHVWVGSVANNRLARFDPATDDVRTFPVPVQDGQPGVQPVALTTGPDGDLWFTGLADETLYRQPLQRCGGEVADTYLGAGEQATSQDDVIVGTYQADVIDGHGGDDVICGRRGADQLGGQVGADRLFGGRGPDRIFGGKGSDECDGGPAANVVRGCEVTPVP